MTHRWRRRRILSNALTLGLVTAGVAALPAAAQAMPLAASRHVDRSDEGPVRGPEV
jgi:hypothetical protein